MATGILKPAAGQGSEEPPEALGRLSGSIRYWILKQR